MYITQSIHRSPNGGVKRTNESQSNNQNEATKKMKVMTSYKSTGKTTEGGIIDKTLDNQLSLTTGSDERRIANTDKKPSQFDDQGKKQEKSRQNKSLVEKNKPNVEGGSVVLGVGPMEVDG
jgi:hypothetical protein